MNEDLNSMNNQRVGPDFLFRIIASLTDSPFLTEFLGSIIFVHVLFYFILFHPLFPCHPFFLMFSVQTANIIYVKGMLSNLFG